VASERVRAVVLVRARAVASALVRAAALAAVFSALAAVSVRPRSAIVRKDGTIEILKVVRGLGLGLDENAIQALKQWKFRPGMKNGVAVDVALNIEVNFSLR